MPRRSRRAARTLSRPRRARSAPTRARPLPRHSPPIHPIPVRASSWGLPRRRTAIRRRRSTAGSRSKRIRRPTRRGSRDCAATFPASRSRWGWRPMRSRRGAARLRVRLRHRRRRWRPRRRGRPPPMSRRRRTCPTEDRAQMIQGMVAAACRAARAGAAGCRRLAPPRPRLWRAWRQAEILGCLPPRQRRRSVARRRARGL